MKKKFALMTIVLVAAVLPFCGCQETKKKRKISAPIYTQTGREIIFNCIATYFQADGSKYFTEQNHTVWPNEQTIVISADEPQDSLSGLMRTASLPLLAVWKNNRL